MIRLRNIAAMLAPFGLVASLSANAATYEILPTSTLSVIVDRSGPIPPGPNPIGMLRSDITLRQPVGPVLNTTVRQYLSPQGTNAFTTSLSGKLGATLSGTQLGFDQGNTLIALGNSGDWLIGSVGGTGQTPGALSFTPTPANFGITAEQRSNLGPLAILQTLNAAPRNGEATLTGSTALSGDPGDQTFETAGLGLNFSSGLIYDSLRTCAGPNCTNSFSVPRFAPISTLPSGQGSLKIVGDQELLTLPLAFTLSDTFRFQFAGPVTSGSTSPSIVEGTATWTANVTGQIIAVREVPEPSTIALLCGGVVMMSLLRSMARRI